MSFVPHLRKAQRCRRESDSGMPSWLKFVPIAIWLQREHDVTLVPAHLHKHSSPPLPETRKRLLNEPRWKMRAGTLPASGRGARSGSTTGHFKWRCSLRVKTCNQHRRDAMWLYRSWQSGSWTNASFGYHLVGDNNMLEEKKIDWFIRGITSFAMDMEKADLDSGESVATQSRTLRSLWPVHPYSKTVSWKHVAQQIICSLLKSILTKQLSEHSSAVNICCTIITHSREIPTVCCVSGLFVWVWAIRRWTNETKIPVFMKVTIIHNTDPHSTVCNCR